MRVKVYKCDKCNRILGEKRLARVRLEMDGEGPMQDYDLCGLCWAEVDGALRKIEKRYTDNG